METIATQARKIAEALTARFGGAWSVSDSVTHFGRSSYVQFERDDQTIWSAVRVSDHSCNFAARSMVGGTVCFADAGTDVDLCVRAVAAYLPGTPEQDARLECERVVRAEWQSRAQDRYDAAAAAYTGANPVTRHKKALKAATD